MCSKVAIQAEKQPVSAIARPPCGRPAEIVIHGLNPAPAPIRKPLPLGILQDTALRVVRDLMGRWMADINRSAELGMP